MPVVTISSDDKQRYLSALELSNNEISPEITAYFASLIFEKLEELANKNENEIVDGPAGYLEKFRMLSQIDPVDVATSLAGKVDTNMGGRQGLKKYLETSFPFDPSFASWNASLKKLEHDIQKETSELTNQFSSYEFYFNRLDEVEQNSISRIMQS